MQKDSKQETQPESILTEDVIILESSLFGAPTVVAEARDSSEERTSPSVSVHPLTDQSGLAACAVPYRQELMLRGKSNYTITCFLSDLKMFGDYIGHDIPVGRITKETLTDWLMKLKFGTDHTPAPKTMARRVTFLKNFFSWLAREGVVREDPSASLTLERPLPPLPELLSEDEIQRLLTAASEDPRCHCLVYLVLRAGLKKEEVMGLTVHFPAAMGKQHRERRLALPAEFTTIFKQYQVSYHLTDAVFECTDRNLNYILARAIKEAGIEKRVTLQLLRDIFAVEQLRAGISLDALREKLGLSDEAWLESKEKYRRLAFPK